MFVNIHVRESLDFYTSYRVLWLQENNANSTRIDRRAYGIVNRTLHRRRTSDINPVSQQLDALCERTID